LKGDLSKAPSLDLRLRPLPTRAGAWPGGARQRPGRRARAPGTGERRPAGTPPPPHRRQPKREDPPSSRHHAFRVRVKLLRAGTTRAAAARRPVQAARASSSGVRAAICRAGVARGKDKRRQAFACADGGVWAGFRSTSRISGVERKQDRIVSLEAEGDSDSRHGCEVETANDGPAERGFPRCPCPYRRQAACTPADDVPPVEVLPILLAMAQLFSYLILFRTNIAQIRANFLTFPALRNRCGEINPPFAHNEQMHRSK
jgi:hypothetical protein